MNNPLHGKQHSYTFRCLWVTKETQTNKENQTTTTTHTQKPNTHTNQNTLN